MGAVLLPHLGATDSHNTWTTTRGSAHYGEWLEAGETLDQAVAKAREADPGPVATAYLYRSASELAEIAGVLGRSDDAARYAELADRVADANAPRTR